MQRILNLKKMDTREIHNMRKVRGKVSPQQSNIVIEVHLLVSDVDDGDDIGLCVHIASMIMA